MTPIRTTLMRALLHQRSGQIDEAVAVCREAVERAPDSAQAWDLLGVLAGQLGRTDEAIEHLNRAIALDATEAKFHYNLAGVHYGRGRLEPAAAAYRAAIALKPGLADAHLNLGAIRMQQRRWHDAAECFHSALAARTDDPSAHHNLGVVLMKLGRTAEAVKHHRAAVELRPKSAPLHKALADALMRHDRREEAEAAYGRAIELDPNQPDALTNLGNLFASKGDLAAAVARYEQALRQSPDHAAAQFNLGVALVASGRYADAGRCFHDLLERDPNRVDAHEQLIHIEKQLKHHDLAREHQAAVLRLRPRDLLWHLRVAMPGQTVFDGAHEIDAYRNRLARVLEEYGSSPLQFDAGQVSASGCMPPYCLPCHGQDDLPLKRSFARVFADRIPVVPARPSASVPRIGFVVTEGHAGVFARGMRRIVNGMPAKTFDMTIVCHRADLARLKRQFDRPGLEFRLLPPSFLQSVECLREGRFDVLYYWEVGTDATNYFLPLYRLAPVQCTSWGWPVTTGIPHMDYFVSFAQLEPPGAAAHYSERLVSLAGLPTYGDEESMPLPADKHECFDCGGDRHVFFCPQNPRKLHPEFDQLLGEVLRRDERGVVYLIAAAAESVTAALRRRQARTLADVIDRVRMLPRMSAAEYQRRLSAADVVLDTLHYGGGANSTYDTLAAGTPLVTLPGAFHRGRFAAACLRTIGVEETIAASADDYVDRATRIAADSDLRHELRRRIAANYPALRDDATVIAEHERFFACAVEQARRQ